MRVNLIFKFFRFLIIKVCYPIFQVIIFFIPVTKDFLRRVFIKINNYIVFKYKISSDPNVLILLPHCLQYEDCVFRITKSIENCRKCGKCVIKDFVNIKEQLSIPIQIATGGTLARKAVKENTPDIILACACERDLSSGIYDSYPFLVFGILNETPNGPCSNTIVDVEKLEGVLRRVLNK
ncbi:DUF116 domain-containing protein [bacterium]